MAHCPICESEKIKGLLSWKKYTIHQCLNCKLIFSSPLPSNNELSEFYQGFLFKKPEDYEIDKQIKKRKKELIKLFDLPIQKDSLVNKKFLDYGGGTGVVYKAASELGMDSYYHDVDKEAKAFTINKFGLTPEKTIDELSECKIKFDYILSDNVIEHVTHPFEFVKDLINQLNNEGVLVIKTPHASNTESFFNPFITLKAYFISSLKYNSLGRSLRAYLVRFWHCDPPRHLYSFSRNSFHYLMSKFEKGNIDHKISYYTIPWFENTITKQFFSKDKRLKVFYSIFLRLIIWPIIPIETSLQILKQLLLKIKVLSPGGIILTILQSNGKK